MQKVVVHTDGGCHGNPGPGGWAATLKMGSQLRELSGGAPATTNNRMELQAAIEALKSLGEPSEVELHTDSNYLRDGVTKWIFGWKRNGWLTKAREPVKNEDLWRQLDAAVARHKIHWHWVKGHAGHEGNERCDQLAQLAIAALKQKPARPELKSVPPPMKAAAPAATVQGLLSLDGL
jgi:ribonuclease HI